MKFAALLLLLGIGLGIVSFMARSKLPRPTSPFTSAVPSPSVSPSTYTIDTYTLYVQPIAENDTLTLVPNFSEKNTAATIFERNNCKYGVNGGFYTNAQQPLGYFYANQQTYESNFHQSSLLSGTVYQITNKHIDTSPSLVQDASLDFAFQSGPFFHPGEKVHFSPDEPDRRMVLAVNDTTQYFIAITQTDNTYGGPLLSELPQLLQKLPLQVSRAINLDGGSASAFFSKSGTRLEEITPVGSFLCGK